MSQSLLSLPPLDAVRGFVAVCRRMSITLAADDLCLTQSAVSRQIQALEEYLRTPLLIRKHRAIALTDAGASLFELASPWLDQLAEYTQSVRNERKLRPVTITASIGVASLWLLPRLGAFQALHPNIDVRLAANDRILDLPQEGLDLAIRYCNDANAPIGAHRLFEEEVLVVASRSVAEKAFASNEALLEQVFLEFDARSHPWLQWSDWLKIMGLADRKPKATMHFNQYDQVIQAAIEGHGVALGRVDLVLPMLKDGRLVTSSDLGTRKSGYSCWLIEASPAPRMEVVLFRDWVLAQVQPAADAATRLG